MAKNRRHQSSKPRRPKIVKSARYREAVKEREDYLAKHKPPKGGSEKIKWQSDGTVSKTLYAADGTTDRVVEVQASGATTTWLPLEVINGEFFHTEASGDVDVCGGPKPFFAATDIIEDASNLPFGECCGGDPAVWARLYCMESLSATGDITYEAAPCIDLPCTTSTEILSLNTGDIECTTTGQMLSSILTGFDPTKPYFSGPLPMSSSTGYPFSGRTLLIWCSGGTVQAIVLDDKNCPDPEGGTDGAIGTFTFDCETFTGEIVLDYPFASCCSGNMQGTLYRVILG